MMMRRAVLLLLPSLAAAQQTCVSDINDDGSVGVDGKLTTLPAGSHSPRPDPPAMRC